MSRWWRYLPRQLKGPRGNYTLSKSAERWLTNDRMEDSRRTVTTIVLQAQSDAASAKRQNAKLGLSAILPFPDLNISLSQLTTAKRAATAALELMVERQLWAGKASFFYNTVKSRCQYRSVTSSFNKATPGLDRRLSVISKR